jgi:recombinational DNA repair ATPase RecF
MSAVMRLRSLRVEDFRAISALSMPIDPALTVLHGNNGHGKTGSFGNVLQPG